MPSYKKISYKLFKKLLEIIWDIHSENENFQLIATTHNDWMFDLVETEEIEKGQILFCEKQKDLSTKIYSLNDFKDPKGDLIENARQKYLIGKYGATPDIL